MDILQVRYGAKRNHTYNFHYEGLEQKDWCSNLQLGDIQEPPQPSNKIVIIFQTY